MQEVMLYYIISAIDEDFYGLETLDIVKPVLCTVGFLICVIQETTFFWVNCDVFVDDVYNIHNLKGVDLYPLCIA